MDQKHSGHAFLRNAVHDNGGGDDDDAAVIIF